jgi:hypothetical protein
MGCCAIEVTPLDIPHRTTGRGQPNPLLPGYSNSPDPCQAIDLVVTAARGKAVGIV